MFQSSTFGIHDTAESKAGTAEVLDTVPIEQVLQKSMAQKQAFNSIVIELVVPGNTAVTAGEVINFSTLTNASGENKSLEEDPYLSGRYLVTEVRHLLQIKQHVTTLICAKDSVGKEYLPATREILNVKEKGRIGTDYDEEKFQVDEKEGILS